MISEIEANWYPRYWRAAKEVGLYKAWPDGTPQPIRTYRLTWLRTFHEPVVVRIDELPDRRFRLTAIRLSGRGGYDPGAIEARVARILTAQEAARFRQALAAAGDLEIAPAIGRNGADGSRWIFETKTAGRYGYINRWTPEPGPLKNLGAVMLTTTGWSLRPFY